MAYTLGLFLKQAAGSSMSQNIKLPRQREITCEKCKKTFRSSLLGVAYCPYCRHPNKLEAGFSPNR
jgi:uncharacterized OB-fold protein